MTLADSIDVEASAPPVDNSCEATDDRGSTTRLRVLYLTYTPFSGRASTTAATEGWFEFLPKKGLEPVLVSHHAGMFHDWAVRRGVPAYKVPLADPDKRRPIPFLRCLWRLFRIAKRHAIQLVHCNEQMSYPVGQYLARALGVPVVVNIHSAVTHGFCEWAFRGRRQPDRVVFLSQGSREKCRSAVEEFVPEARWRVLSNGLNTDIHVPDPAAGELFRREHQLEDRKLIGAASWLRPGKQIEHLFHVVAALNKQRDVTLVIAGGKAAGEEEYADSLIVQGKQLLGDRFRYLGCLDGLRGFLNALDLYVNTSAAETCSVSVIESLAYGCPVVGYPSVSVDEQVLPSGGEIVPQDDWEDLARAVSKWLDDPALRKAARQAARKQVQERYDIRNLADRLWGEYADLLNSWSIGQHAQPLPLDLASAGKSIVKQPFEPRGY
jgi:glycosyltransferase involved in cell wall biosynthesis